ncbi:hypothetical protein HK102_009485 [Quaeritorhiza haematococci]|nr:hypothetical protein HK102_009485 [Quaeritorhiza haematococci]
MDPQETQLELRLRHLEAITAPRLQRDIWASAFSGQGDGSVLSSLQEVQARLTQITQERRAVADFLEFLKLISTASLAFKDASLKDIIENKTNEIDFSALDGAAKKEIVLASEEELLIFAEQLHEIETLKDEVDVPVLRGGYRFRAVLLVS